MIESESQLRFIGYGAMLMESFVGIMALIAALGDRAGRLLCHEHVGGRHRTPRPIRAALVISSWDPLSPSHRTC